MKRLGESVSVQWKQHVVLVRCCLYEWPQTPFAIMDMLDVTSLKGEGTLFSSLKYWILISQPWYFCIMINILTLVLYTNVSLPLQCTFWWSSLQNKLLQDDFRFYFLTISSWLAIFFLYFFSTFSTKQDVSVIINVQKRMMSLCLHAQCVCISEGLLEGTKDA